MSKFGVHSEVGKLRTVMVCRPGLAHQRLTPGNCHDLLFDDVIWVHEAQKDHYDFTLKMQERGVEVLELHDMLEQTLEDKAARAWVLDRRITGNTVGIGVAKAMRPWLDELPAKQLIRDRAVGVAKQQSREPAVARLMRQDAEGAALAEDLRGRRIGILRDAIHVDDALQRSAAAELG